MKTRVLVVEDFEPFCNLICSILKSNPDIRIDCTLGNGIQAVEKVAEIKPHLVLLDIRLPGMNGLEAARRIRDISPGCKIIFLTQEQSTEVVTEALATGADGYVVKADAGTELLVAVDAVLQGRKFVGERFVNLLSRRATDGSI